MFPTHLCPLKPRCIPMLSALHPTSNLTEPEGDLLMDVEGCSGPTAINSSPARIGLPGSLGSYGPDAVGETCTVPVTLYFRSLN
uniref:Uncharacterized protein n=1 Tax=Knipowitschia caucasica TaxID=637954 RepID=A0AAV2KX20_KNICA